MKSWAGLGRAAGGVLLLMAFLISSKAHAAVGRTVGTYAVSPTGAATYTIPIWAPRGPNGLQPAISLTYSSQSGIGYLGVGWGLSGLSSIYRCGRTYAQDPAPAPVTLTSSDVFCMDGQRLRVTGGSYGVAGSTYQTEVANFSNVAAYGSAGNGPGYFEVQGRDGRTYEYGNGGNSQVLASGGTASQWLLDKVTDRAGNTMTISYTTQNGSAVPATISWTPSSHGATTYNYTMTFGYGTNVPQSSIYGYLAGTPVSNTELLTSISVNYTGTTVKNYVLSYQQSPTTSRYELTEVQECADAGATNCLAPTQFTYQSGQIGVSTGATPAISAPVSGDIMTHNNFAGNGDGDLAYCPAASAGDIYVEFASPNGYGSPVDTGIRCTNPLYGDLTGSGKDGILSPNGTDWWYFAWNGSSFTGTDTGLAYDSTASQYVLVDINGDGLPDLLSGYLSGGLFDIYVRLNTGGGGAPSFSGTNSPYFEAGARTALMISNTDDAYGRQQYGTMRSFDFNGDGVPDIAVETIRCSTPRCYSDTVTVFEVISNGPSPIIMSYPGSTWPAVAFLDFNSDGCTDYLVNSTVFVAGCNGTIPTTVSLGSQKVIGAMDWDGDGRTDILVQNGGTIGVYLSQGNGVSGLVSTSIPYNSSDFYTAFDANGDGLDDLGVISGGTVSYYPHNAPGQKPDLLSSVTDGYGNFAKPTYVSLEASINSAYFEKSDAQYPYQNYMGPLYVVNQTTFSDPSNPPNGTYQQTDGYYGAWMNLQGRGFEGFEEVQRHDSRNGLWNALFYDTKFPYTGLLDAYDLTQDQAGNIHVRYGWNNRTYTLLDGTQNNERYFVYFNHKTLTNYEVGGAENGDLIDTIAAAFTYDSYGNATQVVTTTTDNDPGSPYVGDSWTTTANNTPDVDTGAWCLNLLSDSQVSYSASDGSHSVTRTRQYSPDTANCRYTQITTEPSSNTYEVSERLGYDDFGNVDSDVVTGIGMAARQTSASWGATGQFPMSVTDAAGSVTQFNYNFSYGLVSSETDPNGLTTSWQYGDGFGRVTLESRPDGTHTTYLYNDCGNAGGCLMGAHTLEVTHEEYNTDQSIESNGGTYFDELERPIASDAMMLSGNQWNRNEVRYDSLGRIVQRAVPCNWSAVTTPCTYWATMTYDILNRLTRIQRPINQNDSTLQTTTFAYAGRTTAITDPNGHTRTLIRDVNGWLRRTTDALGYTVILGYDAVGNKTSITDNLKSNLWTGTYDYPAAPFLVGETDMDRGSWGYTVDALGEPTAWTDPKGQHFYETYDALSRPVTRTEPDLFTAWTWGSSSASHNIGKLQSVCTGPGSTCSSSYYSESEAYDAKGRLYQRAIAIPSMGTYAYTWQYNASTGFLDTLTYPVSTSGQALELKYAYQSGILQSITDVLDSPNVTVWQADAQNPDGQITQETLGNGLVTSRTYDGVTHWLSSVQSGPNGGASVQNQGFLYDEVGNVTQRQDNNLGLTENFYYDNDNRLSYSTLNGTQNLSLGYDEMGNITSRTDVAGGATWTYDPVHLHEVTQAGSSAYQYAYDANGNVSSRQGSSITWSSYNYPTLINDNAVGESVSFLYGPDRRAWFEQAQSPSGTETTYHVGGMMDIVIAGGTTTDRDFIYAGSAPVAVDVPGSGAAGFHYFQTDQEGSISAITNSSGQTAANESFTAFGARRNPATWSGSPTAGQLATISGITRHGYTFQDVLGSQMGLNDMVGRVQDAVTGRFLSADPTIPDGTDPQSYNRYSYTINNPLTYTDPSGFAHQQTLPEFPQQPSGAGAAGGGDPSIGGVTITATPLNYVTITATPLDDFSGDMVICGGDCQAMLGVNSEAPEGNGGDVVAGSHVRPTGQPQRKPAAQQSNQCTKPSLVPHGGGVTFGGQAEAGVPKAVGASATGAAGVGAFNGPNGWSVDALGDAAATAYAGSHVAGTPTQTSSPSVLGVSAGGGFSLFATNATSVQQLGGPFSTWTLNLGVGPIQATVQVSYGNGIYDAAVSPPLLGESLGFSVSKVTTDTETSNGTCP